MPFLQTDLGKWFFEEHGAARASHDPSLVLLHPLFFDSRMWAPCIGPLAALGRVVIFDAPGHGQSEAPPSFTLADNAAALAQALGSLGIQRAIFIGLSWGGYLAMHMALDHAARTAAIVLMDAAADRETLYRRIKYGLFIAFMQRFGLPLWLVNAQLARLFFAHPTPELCAEMVRIGARHPRDGFIHSALAVVTHRQSLVERLGEISVPTLLIFGREDRTILPAAVQRLSQGIRGSRVVYIEGAGHMAAMDSPSDVSDHLVDFVRGLLSRH